MLSFDQIKDLIELVARHNLRGCEIERAGFRLKLEGPVGADAAPQAVVSLSPQGSSVVAAPPLPPAAARAEPEPPAGTPAGEEAELEGHVLTSPIVGTFYGSPSPDEPSFVEVGDEVRPGQVLCIVEAMKLMNEIESDVDGEIVEILPENAQPVEYGEPLFRIRTS